MGWAGLTLVSDADLGKLEPEATAASSPWGATTWASQRAAGKDDVRIWLEMVYPSVPTVADRVRDLVAPSYVFGYTGSAYTDITSDAANLTESDVALATVFTTFGTDRLYVGFPQETDGLAVLMTGTRNANASVLAAKYWGPSGWTSLSATDGTASSGKTFALSGRITWTVPADWQLRTLNGTGDLFYWIELSISAALTAGTTATQIAGIAAPTALKRAAAWYTLAHIYRGLAPQAASPKEWRDQAEAYRKQAADLLDSLRAGGLPVDLNDDNLAGDDERAETALIGRVKLGRA
jgi:hypothetical protein